MRPLHCWGPWPQRIDGTPTQAGHLRREGLSKRMTSVWGWAKSLKGIWLPNAITTPPGGLATVYPIEAEMDVGSARLAPPPVRYHKRDKEITSLEYVNFVSCFLVPSRHVSIQATVDPCIILRCSRMYNRLEGCIYRERYRAINRQALTLRGTHLSMSLIKSRNREHWLAQGTLRMTLLALSTRQAPAAATGPYSYN